ncbi:hypothetical protein [Streptomyces sp. CB03238]|uniref:hypothetical protein n=1 Tax=Streptomyces sp. CB03238 TaxID=1907777 RepID=UPI001F4E8C76|nr:hypothetical protein [Streptomyces sp. CB03238]
MRRAEQDDEGGRGLFLVGQLAHHWGTGQSSRGKTIWTEQLLPDNPGSLCFPADRLFLSLIPFAEPPRPVRVGGR